MGFFSWLCAKTEKPILAPYGGDWYARTFSKVVVLLPDGRAFSGAYDGYGRVEVDDPRSYSMARDDYADDYADDYRVVELLDLMELSDGRSPRVVLSHYYSGECWSDFERRVNRRDPRQGFFYGSGDIEGIFGPPPPGPELSSWLAKRLEEERLRSRLEVEVSRAVEALRRLGFPGEDLSPYFATEVRASSWGTTDVGAGATSAVSGSRSGSFRGRFDWKSVSNVAAAVLVASSHKVLVDDLLCAAADRGFLPGSVAQYVSERNCEALAHPVVTANDQRNVQTRAPELSGLVVFEAAKRLVSEREAREGTCGGAD